MQKKIVYPNLDAAEAKDTMDQLKMDIAEVSKCKPMFGRREEYNRFKMEFDSHMKQIEKYMSENIGEPRYTFDIADKINNCVYLVEKMYDCVNVYIPYSEILARRYNIRISSYGTYMFG